MRSKLLICLTALFLFGTAAALVADESPALDQAKLTPHEAFTNAETLFVSGHLFTYAELQKLEELQKTLQEADEGDLSLRLASLILASRKKAQDVANQSASTEAVDQIYQTVVANDTKGTDKEHWKLVRNFGLFFFTSGAASALLCGTIFEMNNAKTRNSTNSSDWQYFKKESDFYIAASGVSVGIALFGLIPLLTAEGHLSQ